MVMGMKSKSGHFGNGAGGPSKRNGNFKLDIQLFAKMPKGRAQIMHIMANRAGHMIDTPENRKILETISDDKNNFVRSDPRGFNIYERYGVIQNGGVNNYNFKYHKKREKQ